MKIMLIYFPQGLRRAGKMVCGVSSGG